MYNYQSLYSRYVAPGYEDKTDASHQVAKYLSFSFSIGPSNGYSGLISFRIDWLDILTVQGILKSLLQQHSSKAINSSALSFLYSATLTSIHDHRKKRSLH